MCCITNNLLGIILCLFFKYDSAIEDIFVYTTLLILLVGTGMGLVVGIDGVVKGE